MAEHRETNTDNTNENNIEYERHPQKEQCSMTAQIISLFQPKCPVNVGRTREARAAGVPAISEGNIWLGNFRCPTWTPSVLFEVHTTSPFNAVALSEGLDNKRISAASLSRHISWIANEVAAQIASSSWQWKAAYSLAESSPLRTLKR